MKKHGENMVISPIITELRDAKRQQGFVIDLDERCGDFTFFETAKLRATFSYYW